MHAYLSLMGVAALILVSLAADLALAILVLHETRYIIRLGARLCAEAQQGVPDQRESA